MAVFCRTINSEKHMFNSIVCRAATQLVLIVCTVLTFGCSEGRYATNESAPAGYVSPTLAASTVVYGRHSGKLHLEIYRGGVYNSKEMRLFANVLDDAGQLVTSVPDSMFCGIRDSSQFGDTTLHSLRTVEKNRDTDGTPIAYSLVLDHSGSMGDDRAEELQAAANTFIDLKGDTDAVSIVKFDGKPQTVQELAVYPAHLDDDLGLEGFGGGTALFDATHEAVDVVATSRLSGSYIRKAVVLFTDGQDNSSSKTLESIITRANGRGVVVFVVAYGHGIGDDVAVNLGRMAAGTGGHLYRIYQVSQFGPVFRDIHMRMQNFYFVQGTVDPAYPHRVFIELCDNGKKSIGYIDIGAFHDPPIVENYIPTFPSVVLPPTNHVSLAERGIQKFEQFTLVPQGTATLGIGTGPAQVQISEIVITDPELLIDKGDVIFASKEYVIPALFDRLRNERSYEAWVKALEKLGAILDDGSSVHRYLLIKGYADRAGGASNDLTPFKTVRGMPQGVYLKEVTEAQEVLHDTCWYFDDSGRRYTPVKSPRLFDVNSYGNQDLAFLRGLFVRRRIAGGGPLARVPIGVIRGEVDQIVNPKIRTFQLFLFETDTDLRGRMGGDFDDFFK